MSVARNRWRSSIAEEAECDERTCVTLGGVRGRGRKRRDGSCEADAADLELTGASKLSAHRWSRAMCAIDSLGEVPSEEWLAWLRANRVDSSVELRSESTGSRFGDSPLTVALHHFVFVGA